MTDGSGTLTVQRKLPQNHREYESLEADRLGSTCRWWAYFAFNLSRAKSEDDKMNACGHFCQAKIL